MADPFFTNISNHVTITMNKGDVCTFSSEQYDEGEMFSIQDLILKSGHLDPYIEVIENDYPKSITIKRK